MTGNGSMYQLLPIKYGPKTPSVEMACILVIQNEIQAVCAVSLASLLPYCGAIDIPLQIGKKWINGIISISAHKKRLFNLFYSFRHLFLKRMFLALLVDAHHLRSNSMKRKSTQSWKPPNFQITKKWF